LVSTRTAGRAAADVPGVAVAEIAVVDTPDVVGPAVGTVDPRSPDLDAEPPEPHAPTTTVMSTSTPTSLHPRCGT
jgi:hypothetical protein